MLSWGICFTFQSSIMGCLFFFLIVVWWVVSFHRLCILFLSLLVCKHLVLQLVSTQITWKVSSHNMEMLFLWLICVPVFTPPSTSDLLAHSQHSSLQPFIPLSLHIRHPILLSHTSSHSSLPTFIPLALLILHPTLLTHPLSHPSSHSSSHPSFIPFFSPNLHPNLLTHPSSTLLPHFSSHLSSCSSHPPFTQAVTPGAFLGNPGGPFQHKPFCDSIMLWLCSPSCLREVELPTAQPHVASEMCCLQEMVLKLFS